MVFCPALRDRQQVGLHLFQRDARLQPSLVNEPVIGVGTVEFKRAPDIRPTFGEALRHDSDQRAGRAIEREAPAQDRGVQVEPLLPHLVAHDEDGRRSGFPVFRSQAATHLRRHAEKLEGIRRHVSAVELLGAHARSPQDILVAAAGVAAEDVVLLAELQVFRGFHVGPSAGASAIQVVNAEGGNLLGILIGKWREQHILDHAEHGGARADSERQGKNRQRRESEARTDAAHAVSQVLPQRLHGSWT